MTIVSVLSDSLDRLLHSSARCDALTAARHRAFIAPRLVGSLAVLTAFPLYLAVRGAPNAIELAAFAWLMVPLLLACFLSRTGRYDTANVMSSVSLAGLVMLVALHTGGIESFAALWLIVLPAEAALSGSRRLIGFSATLAACCTAGLVTATAFDVVPPSHIASHAALYDSLGIVFAMIYVAGLAFGMDALARATHARLNTEENRYRLLARTMSDVIVRHGHNGAVQFISPAAEDLFATDTASLLNHGLFDRVHVADRPAYLTALSDAAVVGEARSVEFRIRRDASAGSMQEFLWVEMRCRPLDAVAVDDTARGAQVVSVMRDVTDRKQQEQALYDARAEAERADAAKTRFLATMSHELRTPLNAIIGFSEMIVQEDVLMVDAVRRKEYAQLINDSGHHLLSVVNSILDMSKMQVGNFELSPEPFAPRPALVNCCNLLALKAREGGVDLSAHAPEDLPLMTGDPRAFKQIVLNLLANAVKFTERGGAVRVSADIVCDDLVLRVSDTGVGIAADDLKRIGDPFFQAGTTYQRRHEGTGLGLSIVKSLVALHGGSFALQSRPGEGTTVTVTLPRDLSSPAKSTGNIAAFTPPQAARPLPSMKKSA